MIRKIIFATVLLALATTQALAVNCDLRCALMGASLGHGSCGETQPMAAQEGAGHCHGMHVQTGRNSTAVSSRHSCGSTLCKAELFAVETNSAVGDAPPTSSPLTLSSPFTLAGQAATNSRCSIRRRMHRRLTHAPLEMRPGTSLRI